MLSLICKEIWFHCSLLPMTLDKFKYGTFLIRFRVERLIYLQLFGWIYFTLINFSQVLVALKLKVLWITILSRLGEVNTQWKIYFIELQRKKILRLCFCSLVLNNADSHDIIEIFCLRRTFFPWLTLCTHIPKCLQKLIYRMLPKRTTNTIKLILM